MHMGILSTECLCTTGMSGTHRCQKQGTSDPLGLELQIFLSLNMGAETQTWERNQCS